MRAIALLLSASLLSLSSGGAFAACSASTPASARDATCSGLGIAGVPSGPSANPASGIIRNVVPMGPAPGVFSTDADNECVISSGFAKTAILGYPAPSYSTAKGGGHIGYASATNPAGACLPDGGDLYASCVPWVPISYPYILYQGGLHQCSGTSLSGSVQCSLPGGVGGFVTRDPAANPLYAFMISCRNATVPTGFTVGGSPVSWWADCPSGAGDACSVRWEAPYVHD